MSYATCLVDRNRTDQFTNLTTRYSVTTTNHQNALMVYGGFGPCVELGGKVPRGTGSLAHYARQLDLLRPLGQFAVEFPLKVWGDEQATRDLALNALPYIYTRLSDSEFVLRPRRATTERLPG